YSCSCRSWFFFFFQAEDGIRDDLVTGVQTCALPIFRSDAVPCRCSSESGGPRHRGRAGHGTRLVSVVAAWSRSRRRPWPAAGQEIGIASCRERVWSWGEGGATRERRRAAGGVGVTRR